MGSVGAFFVIPMVCIVALILCVLRLTFFCYFLRIIAVISDGDRLLCFDRRYEVLFYEGVLGTC